MTERCSEAYVQIMNIVNAAKWHKAHCQDSECGVALYMLGLTVKKLVNSCWLAEKERARRIIKETDWT